MTLSADWNLKSKTIIKNQNILFAFIKYKTKSITRIKNSSVFGIFKILIWNI